MATLLEVSKPEYDLMAVESIDRSTDNIVYRVYKPDVGISPAVSESATMNVVYSIRDLGEFFLLSDSYINVKGTYCKDAGLTTALDANDQPALECASTSLFSQSRLRLNGQLIEDNSTLSHINAMVRQLTTLSPDYVATCGTNTGFILDRNTGLAQEIPSQITVPAIPAGVPAAIAAQTLSSVPHQDYNEGFLQRRRQAGANMAGVSPAKVVQRSFAVRLSDLFSCANARKVMKNVSLRIELTTRNQLEILFSDDTSSRFLIEDMELVIAVHNPSLSELARLETELASGNEIPYQYLKYTTYESEEATALSTGSYRSVTFNTSSQKPLGCFIFCQRSIVDAGATQRNFNSMIFDNCNLSNVRVKINGKQYPYTEYETSFPNSEIQARVYSRPYEEFLRFLSKNYDVNSGALITAEEWANLYPLFWIPFHNLSPSPSYQITAEVKNAAGSLIAGGNRHLTKTKIYMTLLTVGEFSIQGDRSGVIVRSQ